MIKKFLDGTSNLLGLAAGCAVILMMLHINLDVAMRYIFSAPFPNTIEIVSSYYIVAIVFLPLALGRAAECEYRRRDPGAAPPEACGGAAHRVRRNRFRGLFRLFDMGHRQDAIEKYQVGEVALGNSQITIWPTRFYLPIGCGLLVLVLLYKAWRLIRRRYLRPGASQ